MIAYPDNLADFLEHEALDLAAVEITPAELSESAQLSQSVYQTNMQWQSYLNSLAMTGFERWLSERSPDLDLDEQHSTLLLPAYASLLPAICNLRVSAFKLCLIVVGSLWDDEVSIPRAAVDLADFRPHLYVLVRVEEEARQVIIQGCLRQDELAQRHPLLVAEEDWSYSVPLNWFDLDPDHLLLYLRCLEVPSLPLLTPISAPDRLPDLRERLQTLQPLLGDNTPIWQRLPWSLGAALLLQPVWVSWLYQQQQGQSPALPAVPGQSVLLPVIKAGLWLRNQLDQTAASLSWQLLPPLHPATAMRSASTATAELETVLIELEHSGVQLTPQARGAYRDISWENGILRLYAVAWDLPPQTAEWSLLVVVGPQTAIACHQVYACGFEMPSSCWLSRCCCPRALTAIFMLR